jgi:hypothetical protein
MANVDLGEQRGMFKRKVQWQIVDRVLTINILEAINRNIINKMGMAHWNRKEKLHI